MPTIILQTTVSMILVVPAVRDTDHHHGNYIGCHTNKIANNTNHSNNKSKSNGAHDIQANDIEHNGRRHGSNYQNSGGTNMSNNSNNVNRKGFLVLLIK